jgi:hypothetical protein
MTGEAFCIAVENLHEKYNDLIKVVPPTGRISIGIAQRVIGSGIHEPDRDRTGKIE